MATFRRAFFPWGVTGLLIVLCLYPKSMLPHREHSSTIPHLDKVIHFTMFAGFALSWVIAGRSPAPSGSRVKGVLAVAFVLAVATELAQGLPAVSRDPDSLDALADAFGATASVGVVSVFSSARRRWGESSPEPDAIA